MQEACAVPVARLSGSSSRPLLVLARLNGSSRSSSAGRARHAAAAAAGDQVTVIGAGGGHASTSRRATRSPTWRTFWAETLPRGLRAGVQPLQGGYFSVDPDDIDPARVPAGRRLRRSTCGRRRATPSTARPPSAQLRLDHLRPGVPGRAGGGLRPVPARAGDGPRVRARRPGPGRACPASIATETQADCLAGAWTAWVADGEAEHSRLRDARARRAAARLLPAPRPGRHAAPRRSRRTAPTSTGCRVPGRVRRRAGGLPRRVRPRPRLHPGRRSQTTTTRQPAATRRTTSCIDIVERLLPRSGSRRSATSSTSEFQPPAIEPFDGEAPDCARRRGPRPRLLPDERSSPSTSRTWPGRPTRLGDFARGDGASPSRTAWPPATSWAVHRRRGRGALGAVPHRLVRREGLQRARPARTC